MLSKLHKFFGRVKWRKLPASIMDIHSLLHANCKKLLEQYTSNIDGVLFLQATLIKDVLPGVADELELDTESIRWAKDWLEDSCKILLRIKPVCR